MEKQRKNKRMKKQIKESWNFFLFCPCGSLKVLVIPRKITIGSCASSSAEDTTSNRPQRELSNENQAIDKKKKLDYTRKKIFFRKANKITLDKVNQFLSKHAEIAIFEIIPKVMACCLRKIHL